MIRRPRRALLWVSMLAGCRAVPVADLAQNQDLYQETGYVSRVPGDRSVFVAPVQDDRAAPVDAALPAPFPIAYDGDNRWQRPVDGMIDELLRRELADSAVFSATTIDPRQADVVLMPALVLFATGGIEEVSGGRSMAEVALRVRAYGPQPPDGSDRPLLLDQVFGDRQVTDLAFKTASRHVLAGAVARATLLRLLQGLDSKNIGRSGMPPAAPAVTIPGVPATAGPAPVK